MGAYDAVVIMLAIFGIAGVVMGIIAQVQKSTSIERNEDEIKSKDKQIKELITRQALLQADLDRKNVLLEDQKRQTTFLERRIEELEARIRELENMLYGAHVARTIDVSESYEEPDTLLIATDPYTQQIDEISLKKAGMNYRRITMPTLDKIEQELRRMRQRGKYYKYIMISGHASESGYELSNGEKINGYWLNQNMSGVEILFLNGCQTNSIADSAIDVVRCIVSLMEDIETLVAQSFAESFWRSIQNNYKTEDAFGRATDVEPSVKPYAYLRCK